MALSAGSTLGSYQIVAPLGAGGMGEVYRALDPKLGREVAIKVLPSHLANDAFSLERFEREARVVAGLSHPNIVRIFDYGHEGDAVYAVMELLEGQTLRQQMAGRSLPLSKAVEYAEAVARGLAVAHDRQVVHRDLKPDNVFVTVQGHVKILDFGVAKARVFEGIEADAPTAAVSQPGAMLGTIEYMAPEQIRGQETDHRADVFAVGVLLFEMITGERPFDRESLPDTMTAILTEDPAPWNDTETHVPPALDQIVTHCLEKRPEDRFQSAHDLAFALTAVAQAPRTTGSMPAFTLPEEPVAGARSGRLWGWATAAGLAIFATGFWLGTVRGSGRAAPRLEFSQLTSQPGIERAPSFGLQGQAFAYVGDERGNADVFLQRIGGRKPINLTQDSDFDDTAPAFSPDGELIAFRSERLGGGIFVMGATGESARLLTDFGFDPTWSPDGTELVVATEGVHDPLSRYTQSALWAVQVADGERRLLFEGDATQPAWSPHGQRIAFLSVPGGTGQRDIMTIPAAGGEPRAVTEDSAVDWSPTWSPDGRWLYFSSDRGGAMSVWRVAIDEASGAVRGEPEALTGPAAWCGELSISADGQRLAFATREERSTLHRVPLAGRGEGDGSPVFKASQQIDAVHLSPDGEWAAFTTRGLREDLFVVRSDGTGFRQLTDDLHRDRGPQWSPDGELISFYSNRGDRYELWTIRPDGSHLDQVTITRSGPNPWSPVWSPDGDRIAFMNADGTSLLRRDDPYSAELLPPVAGSLQFAVSAWSADGSQLAGNAAHPDGSRADGIFVFSWAERAYTRLSDRGRDPLWLGAGPSMLAWLDGGISRFEPADGSFHTLVADAIGDVGHRKFSVSADGERLVYIETERGGDIWLMSFE